MQIPEDLHLSCDSTPAIISLTSITFSPLVREPDAYIHDMPDVIYVYLPLMQGDPWAGQGQARADPLIRIIGFGGEIDIYILRLEGSIKWDLYLLLDLGMDRDEDSTFSYTYLAHVSSEEVPSTYMNLAQVHQYIDYLLDTGTPLSHVH